jgi:hypothetical protein
MNAIHQPLLLFKMSQLDASNFNQTYFQISMDDLAEHVSSCPPEWNQPAWLQCPLCFDPQPLTSSSLWAHHLMNVCPNNPRREIGV